MQSKLMLNHKFRTNRETNVKIINNKKLEDILKKVIQWLANKIIRNNT